MNEWIDGRKDPNGWMDGLLRNSTDSVIGREVDNINLTCNTYISCEYISLNPYIYIK